MIPLHKELEHCRQQLQTCEMRFRNIIEKNADAILVVDIEGIIHFANPAAEALLGYPQAALLGAPFGFPLVVDEISEIDILVSGGVTAIAEMRVVPTEWEGQPAYVASLRDITARKQSEQRIHFQAHLLDTVEQAVIATDLTGCITYWNHFAKQLYGWPASDVIGRNVIDVISVKITTQEAHEIMDRPKHGQSRSGELLAQHRDGRIFPIFNTNSPIYDDEGHMIGVVGISKDITKRKQAEEEKNRLLQQAQQDAETRRTLLHEVNHRVKNNLASIIGLIYAEKRYANTGEDAVYRTVLKELAVRIQGMALVHTMLSNAEWTPLSLSDLAGQILHSTSRMLPREKRLQIDVEASPVTVQPRQANTLALVINELATNTVKYTLKERNDARITVRIVLENAGNIFMEFHDDGPGYPDDVLTLERHNVGFHLIKTLVCEDLNGELTLRNEAGAVATIRFKPEGAGFQGEVVGGKEFP